MGSGIGDYIHYNLSNYLYFGTKKRQKGEKLPSSMATLYNYSSQKNKMMNKINSLMETSNKSKRNLENAISFFFNTKDESKELDEYQKVMKETLETEWSKVSFDGGKVIARKSQDLGDQGKKSLLEKYKRDGNRWIRERLDYSDKYLTTIYTRMNAINLALASISQGSKNYNSLKKEVDDIYVLLEELVKEHKKGQNATRQTLMDREVKNLILKYKQGNGEENPKLKSLITMINNLIKNKNLFAHTDYVKQSGNLFEYAIAAAYYKANGIGAEALRKDIQGTLGNKGAIRGNIKSNVTFDSDFFAKGIDANVLSARMEGYQARNARIVASTIQSQNKMDVLVEWENLALPISAKNYSGYMMQEHGIKLVSGTSLLYLIQDENPDFVNDYFNVIAVHREKGYSIPQQHIKDAQEAMKLTILYKAITGDTFGRGNSKAQIFIVNNNDTGKVSIFDMKDLLKKAYKKDNYYKIIANEIPLDKIKIDNKWRTSGYEARIIDYLMDVHKQKISAYFTPEFLKKMKLY